MKKILSVVLVTLVAISFAIVGSADAQSPKKAKREAKVAKQEAKTAGYKANAAESNARARKANKQK
jgi:hypothetical protein